MLIVSFLFSPPPPVQSSPCLVYWLLEESACKIFSGRWEAGNGEKIATQKLILLYNRSSKVQKIEISFYCMTIIPMLSIYSMLFCLRYGKRILILIEESIAFTGNFKIDPIY